LPTLSSVRRRRFAKGAFLRRSRNAWLSVCSAALALSLAGCGGEQESPDTARLDPAVAERLAGRSEDVAAALDSGDGCGAVEQADALRAELREASVPTPVRREIERTLADAQLVCAPPPAPLPPPPPPPTDADDDDDDEGGGKGKKGKGKKHGHEEEDD
jgi:hypothetical protein